MAGLTIHKLQQQITRVNRRLFLQAWLNYLVYFTAALLLVAALWLVIHPYLLGLAEPWLRWAIVGGALAIGLLGSFLLAWWKGPGRVESALALDERFGLKERVTTFLTLTEDQAQTPAGQALLEDVQSQLASLNVTSKFPLQVSWRRALVPMSAMLLAGLAVFFEPDLKPVVADAKDANTLSVAKAKAIEDKRQEIKKKLEELKKTKQLKSKEMAELELKMDQLFDKDIDPKSKDENRKQAEDIQKLEKENDKLMKEAQAALQKKAELDKQMKDLDKMTGKDDKQNDGPAKDLMDAINKGDEKKVEEEAKKLQEKLANNKIDKDEMKKLEDQVQKMQQQAQKMAEKEQDLKKDIEEAKKSGQASKEEIKQMEKKLEEKKDFKDLAKKLGECQNCMKEGDGKKASEKLGECQGQMQKAANQKGEMQKEAQKLAQKGDELKQLKQTQQMLQEARQNICKNIGMGNGDQKNNNSGSGDKAGGQRPSVKTETGSKDAQQFGEVNQQGQFKIVGDGPISSGKKTKISSKDLPGVFQETAQEAQQAIDRQPISPEAAELLKGYYQNLSGQKKQ